MYHQLYCLVGGLLLILVACLHIRYLASQAPTSRRTSILGNIALSIYALAFSCLVLEFGFYYFLQPDGYGFTLAAKKWTETYWKPFNRFGFRDIEYSNEELSKCKKVVVVGDSFVAGHGIENISDRFTDILREKFGDQYCTLALGVPGWGTRAELAALKRFQYKPDFVILSYYINDIDEVMTRKQGFNPQQTITPPPKLLLPIIDNSYFVNFLYWRIYRIQNFTRSSYWDLLQQAYADEQIWNVHAKDLQDLQSFVEELPAPLFVLAWPNMMDIPASQSITRKVSELFKSQANVKAIDLSQYFNGRSTDTLILNSVDGHPNKQTHAEVAQIVADNLANFNGSPLSKASAALPAKTDGSP